MASSCQARSWRFVSTDLDSNVATVLDRVASDRMVVPLLGVPSWLGFTVPSDSPLVNIPFPTISDDSTVAEGTRLIYAFRQESDSSPYFVCRGAGTSLQLEDTAEQDTARTRVVAWDPWKLAYSRPAQDADGNLPDPMGDWDGQYSAGTEVGEIVLDQLLNTIANNGMMRVDAGAFWGGTGFYTGTLESTDSWSDTEPYKVQPGMFVGDVWMAMQTTGKLDIVLTPIYDPINRPGYTHQLSIYQQAGVNQPDCVFGWDTAPHSLTQLSRVYDGTQRANKIKMGAGQGAAQGATALKTDATSVTKYGEYWGQQLFPSVLSQDGLDFIAAWQLELRKNGKQTVQFSPTPERSPCPFIDYDLGDHVRSYATADNFRQVMDGYLRVYGFPISISDDALEEVKGMVLLPPTS